MNVLTFHLRSSLVWLVLVLGAVTFVGTTELLAQAPSAPPGGGSTTVIVSGRSLSFEWILTVVMCGAALFVVCRSSRRN